MNQSFWMNRFNESLIQTLTCCHLLAIFAFNWKVLHFFFFYNISYFYISNVISKTWILSFNIEIWNIYKYILISVSEVKKGITSLRTECSRLLKPKSSDSADVTATAKQIRLLINMLFLKKHMTPHRNHCKNYTFFLHT